MFVNDLFKNNKMNEGFDELEAYMKDKLAPKPRGGAGVKQGTYGQPDRRRGRPAVATGGQGSSIPQAVDFDRPHSERSAGRRLPRYSDDYDANFRREVDEGSAQDRLHRRHQELRKKSGLPDPNYYKELKASYDIADDQERQARQAEIKKKYRVAEAVNIGQEWISDTELDQYVPDQLQQQWRELFGYDEDGNPSALWANLTGGYEPDVRDPQHRALMVKVANKWFAAKKIPNVRFFDVKDAIDELEWLVQIGEQDVAETALNPKDPQGDYDAKRKVIHDLSLDPNVDQQAVQQRRLDLDREAKAKGLKEQGVAESSDHRQWSNKEKETFRRNVAGLDDMFGKDDAWTKTKQRQIKHQIKTKPMAGPKGQLPEQQGVAEGSITPDVTVDKVHDDGHEKEWHVFRGKEMIGYVIKNQPDTSEGLYIAYGHGPGRAFVKEFRGLKSAVNYITSLKEGVAEGVEQYLEEMRRAGYDIVTERATLCPECGGPAYEDKMLAEKQDACYHKVKSRYKVWPSAYASGALVRCRKVGAKNWGNKSKK